MMEVIFTPAARVEIVEAQDWYEMQQAGLGVQFREQLRLTVARMADNPFQFPIALHDVRSARLRKFPYILFFRSETDLLIVIACFHAKRNPRRWQQRV